MCDTSCPIGKLPFSFLFCDEFLKTYFLSMPQLSKYVKLAGSKVSKSASKLKSKVLGADRISLLQFCNRLQGGYKLRVNVHNGETYRGNSQKLNSAHVLRLGRP